MTQSNEGKTSHLVFIQVSGWLYLKVDYITYYILDIIMLIIIIHFHTCLGLSQVTLELSEHLISIFNETIYLIHYCLGGQHPYIALKRKTLI